MRSEKIQILYRLALILGILFFLATGTDAGTTAFVSNRSENTLSIIDVSDGTLLQTIPTGRGPQGLALSPDGQSLYIAQSLDDAVLVLSTSDFSVQKSIATAGAPTDIAVTPDGELLYVTCRDRIEVIRTGDDTITEFIPAVGEPSGLALTPDGRMLFVTSVPRGTLTVINTRNLTLSDVIDLGSAFGPSGIRIAPGGDFLYVTQLSSTKVLVLDTRDLSIQVSIDLGLEPSGIAFSPDGTFAYAQHAKEGFLSEIRTSDHWLMGRKPYGPLSMNAGVALTYTAAESQAGGIAIPVGAIMTPTFLNASASGLNQISLSWTDTSDNETGFEIERRTSDSAFSTVYRVGLNITYYRDTGLDSYTTYYYRVRAYNTSTGEYSPYSNEASATTHVTDDDDDDGFFFCAVTYILTGTPFGGHMNKLREFRDKVLMKSGMGRTFVKFYYSLSPGLLKIFQKYDILKHISKALLVPLIYIILYPALLFLLPIFFILPLLLRRIGTFAGSPA